MNIRSIILFACDARVVSLINCLSPVSLSKFLSARLSGFFGSL